MDWLDRMNNAIDYIENNLLEEIDIEQVAKIAYCSTYHFQKIFSFIANIPLSEYIRHRRLTLAALDLQNMDDKIIDIALKYGYSSPTAFTRAFSAVHGVAPKIARNKGIKLKSFPKITFHISIIGGSEMNYRIEDKKEFRLVGIKEVVTNIGGANMKRIPKIWEEVCNSGMGAKIASLSNGEPSGVLGVCANFRNTEFDYFIASSTNQKVPDKMEELIIPANLWVIFECVGSIPDAIQNVWRRIFTEWFPSSGYEHAEAPEIEWYSDGDNSADDYKSEIWIPVRKI